MEYNVTQKLAPVVVLDGTETALAGNGSELAGA